MTRHFMPGADDKPGQAMLLIEAARCWRDARDAGLLVQPRLSRLLSPQGLAVLAPVFDSLLRFLELALGRRVLTGWHASISADEHLLLNLLEDRSRWQGPPGCPPSHAAALQRAVDATRIMLAMAIGGPPAAEAWWPAESCQAASACTSAGASRIR